MGLQPVSALLASLDSSLGAGCRLSPDQSWLAPPAAASSWRWPHKHCPRLCSGSDCCGAHGFLAADGRRTLPAAAPALAPGPSIQSSVIRSAPTLLDTASTHANNPWPHHPQPRTQSHLLIGHQPLIISRNPPLNHPSTIQCLQGKSDLLINCLDKPFI